MRGLRIRLARLLVWAASLAAAGCVGSSRPARFYTLAPLEVRDGSAPAASDATLAVGPVEVADYLDRHQIVTRAGANGLVIADFDRWGESLERESARALVATLADRLASRNVLVVPSGSLTPAAAPSGYRAAITISRFDGTLGKSVVLQGRWELFAHRDGKHGPVAVRGATVTEKIDGAGYDALVAAMQRALARFGAEMADDVATATAVARAP